jgi:hypothetical protein
MWAEQVPLLDYRTLDWNMVRRTRYFCYQRFHYLYPGPIRNLNQQLIVVPPDHYADQTLCDQKLTVAPHPATSRQRFDRFGNRVWELHVRHIDREIAFEVITTVDRSRDAATSWLIDRAEAEAFLQPTQLTQADERIRSVAALLWRRSGTASNWLRRSAPGLRTRFVIPRAPPVFKLLRHKRSPLARDCARIMRTSCLQFAVPPVYRHAMFPGICLLKEVLTPGLKFCCP